MLADLDWDKMTFSLTPTDSMYRQEFKHNQWQEGQYIPYGDIQLSPAASVINYGQGLFEGMKAWRTVEDDVVLFRPEKNAARINEGAEFLGMPTIDPAHFLDVVKNITKQNTRFVPPMGRGALYVRPLLFGSEPRMGIVPADEVTFLVYASPVGNYFKHGLTPIRLHVPSTHRVAPRGAGHVKYIGNYASSMGAIANAKREGFDNVLYLDAKHDRYVEEVGAANFFCVINGELHTPALGTILPGNVRDAVIQLVKEKLGMTVHERQIDVDELKAASECFCTGTAAVITPIAYIEHNGKVIFDVPGIGSVTRQLYDLLTAIFQGKQPDEFGWLMKVV